MLRRAVRVKRCGKSAPRTRQRGRHGKPHREQNRIGTTLPARAGRGRFPGPVVRVGCSRRAAMRVPEEWPSRRGSDPPAIQNPAYRPTGTSITISSARHPGRPKVDPGSIIGRSALRWIPDLRFAASGMTAVQPGVAALRRRPSRSRCCPASRASTGRPHGPSSRGPRPRPCPGPAPRPSAWQ